MLQQILSSFRRAVTDFDMIQDGDRIAVGLSGGKDSLALLTALAAYRMFSPQRFELFAVTVDLGFKDADFSVLAAYAENLNVPYTVIKTDIAQIIFEERKEKNPCSLCSKMRRGALNAAAVERGFNKLALGHHADDVSETFFLSLLYEGRLSTFAPVSYMDRTGITLIRPLIYTEEKTLRAFSKTLPVLFNPCPANHATQREYMKKLIQSLNRDIPGAAQRIHAAVTDAGRYNLFPPKKGGQKNASAAVPEAAPKSPSAAVPEAAPKKPLKVAAPSPRGDAPRAESATERAKSRGRAGRK